MKSLIRSTCPLFTCSLPGTDIDVKRRHVSFASQWIKGVEGTEDREGTFGRARVRDETRVGKEEERPETELVEGVKGDDEM